MENGRIVEKWYVNGKEYSYDIWEYEGGHPVRRILKLESEMPERVMEIKHERVGDVDVYREYIDGEFVGMWAEVDGRLIYRGRGDWWEVKKYDDEGRVVEYRTEMG